MESEIRRLRAGEKGKRANEFKEKSSKDESKFRDLLK